MEEILKLVLIALGSSLIEYFYQFLLEDGMLLSWVSRILVKMDNHRFMLVRAFAKPLGLCAFCNIVWIDILSMLYWNPINLDLAYCTLVSMSLAIIFYRLLDKFRKKLLLDNENMFNRYVKATERK
ncbi:hypothetical protein FACS1894195_0130 [Bacteroidia bacterium]|nr:hypothetical protein FACS1894195_0130 [Bacteroidia bacterium]